MKYDYDEKRSNLITRQEIACFLFALKNKIIPEDETTEILKQKLIEGPTGFDKNSLNAFASKKKEILKKFKEIPFSSFKNAPIEVLREVFCVKVFQDSYKNVMTNLKTFNEAFQKGFLNEKDNFKRLGEVFNLLNSNKEIINSVNLERYSGLKEVLYDAFKEMQEQTFSDIKKSLYTLEEVDIDQKLSEGLGVKVYKIGKQPKKMLMHVSWIEKKNMQSEGDYFEPKGKKNVLSEYIALSYVDNGHLKTYRNLDDYITVIYGRDIPQDHLVAISDKDAFVSYEWPSEDVKEKGEEKGLGTTVSNQKQLFLGAKELLEKTQVFNEISILRQDAASQNPITTRPIAVFCRREISNADVSFAKKYGLPIVLSNANYSYKSQWTDKTRFDNTDYLEM